MGRLQRGYGVCRDLTPRHSAQSHFNLPTRYVTGHYLTSGSRSKQPHGFPSLRRSLHRRNWFTTDARFHVPRIGRIKVSCGQDAVDGAFSTIYGGATLTYFQVWAYQVHTGL